MALTFDVAHVQAYEATVHRLVAKEESLFRKAVRQQQITGKWKNFERLGSSELPVVTGRHQQTQILNPEHSRRRAVLADRGGAILIDRFDLPKALIDPQSDYARNHAEAINRAYDVTIITALLGSATAVAADESTSAVTLASFNSGSNVIANGTTGMTFEKVNKALRLANQNKWPMTDRWFAISPQGLEDLLDTPEATSSDFAQLKAIQTGTLVGTWMGFNWIMEPEALPVTTLVRSCIAWHRTGLGLAIGIEKYTSVKDRPDLNDNIQVYAAMSIGAVRTEEARVIQVDILEEA